MIGKTHIWETSKKYILLKSISLGTYKALTQLMSNIINSFYIQRNVTTKELELVNIYFIARYKEKYESGTIKFCNQ